jgi:SAM-dependent methyltransferase
MGDSDVPGLAGEDPRDARGDLDLTLKARVPWSLKIAAKLVLSRLPVGYGFWRRIGIFKLGEMESPAYAYAVFKSHFERSNVSCREGGFAALELGPGDTLFSALIAPAFGAGRTYLVDVQAFAREDLEPYRRLADFLRLQGLPAPPVEKWGSLSELLSACGARYETRGLESLCGLPDHCVDFFFSHAVIEHIRKRDFLETFRQFRRVLRPDGVGSHRVDLRDHLSDGLNSLRFSEGWWESKAVTRSGFYTNRLRFSEMLRLFREAGFVPEVINVERWEKLPTPRNRMAEEFCGLPEEELRVMAFDVILRPGPLPTQ